MTTVTDLLDCLRYSTLAAIATDVQVSGDPQLARFLAEHLGTTMAPAAALRQPSPATGPIPPLLALTPVDAPVPPMLEAAIGYDGDVRWVAFYWQPAGDECCYDDGQTSLCGANWGAFLAYTQHPAVWPHLALSDFGSSDEPARHWLVLDRCDRHLYAAPWGVARAFLRCQERPPAEDQTPRELPTAAELLALLQTELYTDAAQIAGQMAQAEQARVDLITWLDDYAKRQEEK